MNTYIEVGQFNYTEELISSNGKKYYSNYHKAPDSLAQAREWAANKADVLIIEGLTDEEVMYRYPRNVGGLYRVEHDGSIKFIKGCWDSSG